VNDTPAGTVAQAEALSRNQSLRTAGAFLVALGGPALVSLLALSRPHQSVPALLFVVAILVATALGGRFCGLLAAAVSVVPFYYFFLPPRNHWSTKWDGALALAVFLITAVLGGEFLIRQAGARERAEEEVTSRNQALDAASRLQAAADALATARTPQEVLDAVLSEGVRAAEARSGLIATLSQDGESLNVIASRGYNLESIAPYQSFSLAGNFPLSEAVRTGQGVFIGSGEEQDARYPELVGGMQPRHALVCLPLVGHAGPIGGLVFSFASDQEFTAERRALKFALARQAGLALERSLIAEKEAKLRERLAFLDASTALLTSSLDLRETLDRLASLAIPQLSDWCTISVVDEETGLIEQIVVAHQDPERKRWAEDVQRRTRPIHLDDEFDLTARVIRTGEPVFLPVVPQQLLDEAVERDPEAARALEEISIRSAITVALSAGSRHLGALTLVAEQREFGEEDFELAQHLSSRAAIALENARLYAETERRADAALALAYVGDGVVLLDHSGRVRFWNSAAAAITGVRSEQATGRLAEEVLPSWAELTRMAELAGPAAPSRARSVTLPFETATGDRWVSVTGVAFDEGVVYALRDVTDERLLERARSDFVATASHELRTPLAAVYGAARTLRRTDIELPSDQRDRFLEIIESETERLTAIVSQILLAGQLEEGRVDLATSATDLRGLAESVLDSTRVRAPVEVELKLDPGGVSAVALADEDKLRQVLVNLLDNAVKYSPDGGEVAVELGSAPGLVTLTVRDAGLGIPAGEQERIFEKFYRLDPALTRGVGGSGLGLYISRELVSRMGGRMSVRSRPGEGAAFTVELPAA
jgi:PAS domain S-box-containing protein